MASEIRVDKINSLSGVGTVTLSPTGVDIAGITTVATLKATTGIVTTLTATTGIVTTLTANTVTSLGAVSGTTGTFSGAVSGTTGTFSAAVSGTTGTFSGAVSGTTGTFSGAVSGTTGTFTGNVDIAANIRHIDDTDTYISFPANNEIEMYVASQQAIKFTTTSIETGDNKRIDIIDAAGDRSGEIKNSDSTANSLMISADPDNSGSNSVIQFSLDGSEKSRLDTSGRLLIGNTDGATYADSSMDDLIIGSTANGKNDGITILSGTGQNGTLAFADSGGSSRGLVGYVHNGDYLRLHAGATLKARIDTDGLKFNSDTAAANALNDYEEGTWTVNTTVGSPNTTHGASYTKIGRSVTVSAYITCPISSSGNNFQITSLPFTTLGGSNYAIGAAYTQVHTTDNVFVQVNPGNNDLYVYKRVGNSVTFADLSGAYLLFTVTYFTG